MVSTMSSREIALIEAARLRATKSPLELRPGIAWQSTPRRTNALWPVAASPHPAVALACRRVVAERLQRQG